MAMPGTGTDRRNRRKPALPLGWVDLSLGWAEVRVTTCQVEWSLVGWVATTIGPLTVPSGTVDH